MTLAFERWRNGTGGLFELLAPDVRWEILGRAAVSGFYFGKESFMTEVIAPLGALDCARVRLVPTVRGLFADGDTVVALFGCRNRGATDGLAYRNNYSWFLRFEDERIVDVVAFFDSTAFNELWSRVTPKGAPDVKQRWAVTCSAHCARATRNCRRDVVRKRRVGRKRKDVRMGTPTA